MQNAKIKLTAIVAASIAAFSCAFGSIEAITNDYRSHGLGIQWKKYAEYGTWTGTPPNNAVRTPRAQNAYEYWDYTYTSSQTLPPVVQAWNHYGYATELGIGETWPAKDDHIDYFSNPNNYQSIIYSLWGTYEI